MGVATWPCDYMHVCLRRILLCGRVSLAWQLVPETSILLKWHMQLSTRYVIHVNDLMTFEPTDLQVDKVQFISYLRELPTAERRNAELALFFRQPHQAEAIYLQAGLIFRAIQLNMSLFNWERSEDIIC